MSKLPFINTVIFSPPEANLIQQICTLELEAIMEGITDVDKAMEILIYENLNDLPYNSILPLTWQTVYAFSYVKDNPEKLMLLEEDHISIFKHIMHNFFDTAEWEVPVKGLTYKLSLLHNLENTTTLN